MAFVHITFFVLALVTAGASFETCEEELMTCMNMDQTPGNDACTNFVSWMNCVSGTGDHCELEETNGVTFKSIQKVAKNSCAAFVPLIGMGSQCQELMKCLVENTRFVAVKQDNTDILNDTVKTGFWCSLMEGPLNCAITNAKACGFQDNKVTSATQQVDKVKEVCGAGTIQEGTLTTVLLVLSAAALLLKLTSA